MLKKEITYTDYNGVKRTETHYFNLSRSELLRMEMTEETSLKEKLTKMIQEKSKVKLYEYFEWLVLKSYGIKSEDGKRFEKSEEISKAFSETEAYTELILELCSGEDKVLAFVDGIMPTPVPEEAKKQALDMISENVVPISN